VAIVRPFSDAGRFGQQTFERVVVSGTWSAAPPAWSRPAAPRFARCSRVCCGATAALLLVGGAAVVLYFLAQT